MTIADMTRASEQLSSAFVAELARRLQGQGSALALPLTWIEQRLSEYGLTIKKQGTESAIVLDGVLQDETYIYLSSTTGRIIMRRIRFYGSSWDLPGENATAENVSAIVRK